MFGVKIIQKVVNHLIFGLVKAWKVHDPKSSIHSIQHLLQSLIFRHLLPCPNIKLFTAFGMSLNSLKLWIIFAFISISCHAKPVCIDNAKEYAILEQFFRMAFSSEEYGYVLEGSKPISIRNFLSLDSFPMSKNLQHEERQFANAVLVRKAIPLWNKFCSQQKNYVLKGVPLNDQVSCFLSPLEVAFINVSKLQEVIEKNIDLFRYILGPTNTVQGIVDAIAHSKQSLNAILNHNLTLTGIVLGFGSHNSIVGGRQETICALSISKDSPPFSPQSKVMQSEGGHSLDFLTPERYGAYYLELAGGDDVNFRIEPTQLHPQSGFTSLVEELQHIDQLEEQIPPILWQNPKFVFGAFKGGKSNQPFFKELKKTQKKILSLLHRPRFLEHILERLSPNQPIVRVKKENSDIFPSTLLELPEDVWNEVLCSVANRFTDDEKKSAFQRAFSDPQDGDSNPPEMMGVSQAVLEGLKKARNNLAKADVQFEELSQDTTLNELVFKKLYFKTTFSGNQKRLNEEERVRIRFVIEDGEENILFANSDLWINLSETFSGFAHGLKGMHLKEKRTLFIHPTLAYGALTSLPPCSSLTVKVQLLDIDPQVLKAPPQLTPLDLSWIKDVNFYNKIEESLFQQPYFTGFFYRELFNAIYGKYPASSRGDDL